MKILSFLVLALGMMSFCIGCFQFLRAIEHIIKYDKCKVRAKSLLYFFYSIVFIFIGVYLFCPSFIAYFDLDEQEEGIIDGIIKITEYETVHDTVYITVPDSQFECPYSNYCERNFIELLSSNTTAIK